MSNAPADNEPNHYLSDDLALAKEASALRELHGHWGEHPELLLEYWRIEVAYGDTRLGYWEWIANSLRGDQTPNLEPQS